MDWVERAASFLRFPNRLDYHTGITILEQRGVTASVGSRLANPACAERVQLGADQIDRPLGSGRASHGHLCGQWAAVAHQIGLLKPVGAHRQRQLRAFLMA